MMGTLTGGIAHEFNNFLTPITGYADLIMADADPGSEIYDNAMEISEAAQKAQEVVKQISSMSRKTWRRSTMPCRWRDCSIGPGSWWRPTARRTWS